MSPPFKEITSVSVVTIQESFLVWNICNPFVAENNPASNAKSFFYFPESGPDTDYLWVYTMNLKPIQAFSSSRDMRSCDFCWIRLSAVPELSSQTKFTFSHSAESGVSLLLTGAQTMQPVVLR